MYTDPFSTCSPRVAVRAWHPVNSPNSARRTSISMYETLSDAGRQDAVSDDNFVLTEYKDLGISPQIRDRRCTFARDRGHSSRSIFSPPNVRLIHVSGCRVCDFECCTHGPTLAQPAPRDWVSGSSGSVICIEKVPFISYQIPRMVEASKTTVSPRHLRPCHPRSRRISV